MIAYYYYMLLLLLLLHSYSDVDLLSKSIKANNLSRPEIKYPKVYKFKGAVSRLKYGVVMVMADKKNSNFHQNEKLDFLTAWNKIKIDEL